MATLHKKKSGCWSIQYDLPGIPRKTVTLPSRFDERTAEDLRKAVTKLLYFRDNGLDYRTEDKRLRTWIETASPIIREKLAAHGFIVIPKRITTKELWDGFLAQKKDVVQDTLDTYEAARIRFFSFFKENEWVSDLSKERMIEWKGELLNQYAPATVAGTLAKAKAVFNWSVGKHWLETSPLKGVGKGSYRNELKDREITMEEYGRLLDACICQEWRVIISLARIGGLRCPSECIPLRWTDIDWEKDRFSFLGSKCGPGGIKRRRTIPLFSELRRELEALRDRDKGLEKEFVINRYRNVKQNLGTQFDRIAKAAGLGVIDRPFDNMRASRSTEIFRKHGPKVESEWIGHSTKTAIEDYLMVTEADFARAVGKTPAGQ